jgi:hypothetical protein
MERFSKEEDRKYRKVYGGIAWPGKRPGFAIIIGQTREQRLGGYDMVFLDEVEAGDTRALVRACGGFDYFYRPEVWVGDTKNDAGDKFIREMNNENESPEKYPEGERLFRMRRSPILDMKNAFAYFFPVLKELLNPDRRRLFLKEGSRLKGYMYQPQEADLATIDFGDYPAIEALALAVMELDRDANRPRKKYTTVQNEYERV